MENSVLSGGLGWVFWLKPHTPVFEAEFDEKCEIAGDIDGGVPKSADLDEKPKLAGVIDGGVPKSGR